MNMRMYRWEHLDWETIERQVFKLQKRIYQASQRGDVKTVHTLERLLMRILVSQMPGCTTSHAG
jgi:RNA-directed DNA polymerase